VSGNVLAVLQPTVTVGMQICIVIYAGGHCAMNSGPPLDEHVRSAAEDTRLCTDVMYEVLHDSCMLRQSLACHLCATRKLHLAAAAAATIIQQLSK
jgi:hypothetical protein